MIRKYQGAGKVTYSGKSIAQQLLEGTRFGKWLGYGNGTYTDGYGTTRNDASLKESANGQELERMGETAKGAAELTATGLSFANPVTASKVMAPLIVASQAYWTGTGFKDGVERSHIMLQDPSQQTIENYGMLGLDFMPVPSVAKQVIRGAKQVVPAAKQLVKEAEAVNYAGMKADANAARKALTSGKTRIKVGDVEINNPNLNYRQVGSGAAKDFIETGNQFSKIKPSGTDGLITLRLKQPLDNPMYKQGSLWYGINNAENGVYPDLLVTAEPMNYATKYGHLASVDKGGRRIPSGTLNSENTGAYVFEPGYGYRKVQTDPKISVSLPYDRVAPTDGRINTARNYYAGDDFNNYVQVINDTKPGYYSVHFKTNQGSPTSNAVQKVVDKIVSDLPGGSKVATWGSVTKGGFSGLDRFAKAGMIKTGEFRPLAFKDQSVANEVAEKYGLTLNADGTINWPIVLKNSSFKSSKVKKKNYKVQKEYPIRLSMKEPYKRNNNVDLNQVQQELEDGGIYFEQNKPTYTDPISDVYTVWDDLDKWGRDYFKKNKHFITDQTSLDLDIQRKNSWEHTGTPAKKIIWDNYVSSMNRRRHDYFFDGIRTGDYPPYVYFDKTSERPSAIFGFKDPENNVFMPSHFAPANLRSGLKMIKDLLDIPQPVVFAVPEDLSNQLYKLGYTKIANVPQPFGNDLVMKDIMVNRNFSADNLPRGTKSIIKVPTTEKWGKQYFSKDPVPSYGENIIILKRKGGKI